MALTKLQAAVIEGVLGLIWQSPAKTSSFAAVIDNGYYLNTTTGSITVTLPSSPTVGDSIGIIDYAGTAASNAIILTSSNNIQGSSDDKIVNYTRGALRITYADTTQGWVASAAANEGTSALNPNNFLVNYLVVAGGGSGGSNSNSGGAGAGGYRTNYGSTALSISSSTTYNITVGAGGTANVFGAGVNGNNGNNSVFDIITSTAGGAGGAQGQTPGTGGSGGGGGYDRSGSAGNAGGFSPVEGYAGGSGTQGGSYPGGGGGGASEVGNTDGAGHGGDGTSNSITGSAVFYAGGGSAGVSLGYPVIPGSNGGGGAGGAGDLISGGTAATRGIFNTGGGGGGGSAGTGGAAGGSGTVILRYPTADVSSFAVTGTLDTLSNTSFPTTNQGLYQFNGNINDSSGNGNNISVTGSVSYTTGLYGQCAVLGSSTTSLNTGISGALAQTWSVWVKMPASLGSGYRIVNSLNNSGDAGQYINYNSSNELRIGDILGGATSSGVTVITDLGTEWHNIVNVNNTTQSLMYLDGSLIATNTAASGNLQTGNSIYFGRGPYGTAINGMNIDQSRIINSALSASDVAKLYNEGQIIETTDGSNSILQFKGGTGTITFS